MRTTVEKFGEAFAYGLRQGASRARQEPLNLMPVALKSTLTIAITRECGANGTEVAQLVGTRLNWPVYDRKLVEKVASDAGVRTEMLESLDEKHQSAFAEWLTSLVAGTKISSPEFSRHLMTILSSLAAQGHCVIVGRGAALVLPAATTLRVRLIAPLDVRNLRIQKQFGITEHEAARRIRETDLQRNQFVSDHFLKDVSDVHLYDLVLNTARLSLSQCAEVIVTALHELESPE